MKRSASFIGHVMTLCDNNSLLFPLVEAQSPPCEELSGVPKARDAQLRWLRATSLNDVSNHVHVLENGEQIF